MRGGRGCQPRAASEARDTRRRAARPRRGLRHALEPRAVYGRVCGVLVAVHVAAVRRAQRGRVGACGSVAHAFMRRMREHGIWRGVGVVAVNALALSVMYSRCVPSCALPLSGVSNMQCGRRCRYYLQYHTLAQIGVGCACGAAFGALWYGVTERVCASPYSGGGGGGAQCVCVCARAAQVLRPAFPAVADTRMCRALFVRDCSGAGNLVRVEYDAVMARRARGGARRPPG